MSILTPGCGAVDSASGLGPEGRRFESYHPDQTNNPPFGGFFVWMNEMDENRRFGGREKQTKNEFIRFCRASQGGVSIYRDDVLSPRPFKIRPF